MAHPTIADFQLTRSPHPIPWEDPDSKFLDTVLPSDENSRNENWAHWTIDRPRGSEVQFEYSVSIALQTLIVRIAFLRDVEADYRYTDMYANQLIADCWRAAVEAAGLTGDARGQLRYLALHQVTETASLAAMENERDLQIEAGIVTRETFYWGQAIQCTEESSPYWKDNAWLRCSRRVAQVLSDDAQRFVVSRAIIRNDRLNSEMDLVVELTPAEAPDEALDEEMMDGVDEDGDSDSDATVRAVSPR